MNDRAFLWLKHAGLSLCLLVLVSGMVLALVQREPWLFVWELVTAVLVLAYLTLPKG